MNLNKKIIIVTGASGFIGQEICVQVLKNGGNLIAIGNNKDKLKNLKSLLTKKGFKRFSIHSVNLKKTKNISEFKKNISLKYKYVSGIVNCAYSGNSGDLSLVNEKILFIQMNLMLLLLLN